MAWWGEAGKEDRPLTGGAPIYPAGPVEGFWNTVL